MMLDFPIYLNAVTGLFLIIDPLGAAIIFHSLVPANNQRFRIRMALKSTLIATSLLIVFGLYGEALLNKLGISIAALRISGGLLLFYTAFNMVTKDHDVQVGLNQQDISVYPMSIPLLAGPGSLTLAILLFSGAESTSESLSVLAAVLSILSGTLLLMLLSGYVRKLVGRTGDEIIRRFLGVLLAALAIQFITDGIKNIAV